MEWLYGLGLLVVALLFLWVQSMGRPDDPDGDLKTRPYQWGDELHEYSYRHPWDDEL